MHLLVEDKPYRESELPKTLKKLLAAKRDGGVISTHIVTLRHLPLPHTKKIATIPTRHFAGVTIPRYTEGHIHYMETKTVLSIEDDAFLSSLVSGKLIESGFSVLTAGTGADGLAKARQEHPHLILLDIMLPDMGGFEILEQLKKDPATQDIPVIILSNLGGRDEIERGVSLGACSYLIKSNILPHEVAEMVQSQIEANGK